MRASDVKPGAGGLGRGDRDARPVRTGRMRDVRPVCTGQGRGGRPVCTHHERRDGLGREAAHGEPVDLRQLPSDSFVGHPKGLQEPPKGCNGSTGHQKGATGAKIGFQKGSKGRPRRGRRPGGSGLRPEKGKVDVPHESTKERAGARGVGGGTRRDHLVRDEGRDVSTWYGTRDETCSLGTGGGGAQGGERRGTSAGEPAAREITASSSAAPATVA
jgi:hypothetical protein